MSEINSFQYNDLHFDEVYSIDDYAKNGVPGAV